MHNSGKAFYALAFVCLFIWSFFVIFWGCLALRILFTLTDAEIYQEAERHVIPMDSKYQSDKVVLADSIQLDEERDQGEYIEPEFSDNDEKGIEVYFDERQDVIRDFDKQEIDEYLNEMQEWKQKPK